MTGYKLQLKNVGQIKHANVEFGDLTVLVGPQATGKSIFLEFLKLLLDTGSVLEDLKRHGLVWDKDINRFLDIYLGEGMHGVWREKRSAIFHNANVVNLEYLIRSRQKSQVEQLFYIPAQRALTLGKGWPRPFTDYSPGDPYCVRDFSDKIRLLMETEPWSKESLFPQRRRLTSTIRKKIIDSIFHDFGLGINKRGPQKQLVLQSLETNEPLPFMVWSAGQREFVPLLLGLYHLLPPNSPKRDNIKWVVIEEPEMGLHPKAISAVMLAALFLLSRDYRVCISTHSPHVLDIVWALKIIQEHKGNSKHLLDIFDVKQASDMTRLANAVLKKTAKVYYFDPASGETRDISNLDPGSEEIAESGWGGLTEFSGRVGNVIADVVNGVVE